jgi:hypothetical protein
MKLGVTLDILNQKDTPAFYADTLANRPAAGFTGRVFISTDTLDLYRDTGTTWVLLSPSSTGTITGSGAAGQVTYFSAASSITGSNDLFFDSVNGHLGIGTITPSTALTIFHDQNQIIQINQTTATNDTKIAFQNSGTPLWRIGNSYNAGANDYAIYDVVGALQPLTIKKTTGQTFIGSQTTSSGLLVVNSSTADNQIVAIGANSPSIRVRNAGTAPTQQFGLGLATATNNFIQGSASGDFCIFNGSTTASPILFGVYDAGAGNVQEAARITAARNFLLNTTTDGGFKFTCNGTAKIVGALETNTITIKDAGNNGQGTINFGSTNGYFIQGGADYTALNFYANNTNRLTITSTGNVGIGTTTPTEKLVVTGNIYTNGTNSNIYIDNGGVGGASIKIGVTGTTETYIYSLEANDPLLFGTNNTERLRISSAGNLLIGKTTDNGNKLQVEGTAFITGLLTVGGNIYSTYKMSIGNSNQTAATCYIQSNDTTVPIMRVQAAGTEDIFNGRNSSASLVFRVQDTGEIQIGNPVTAAVGIASTHKVSILIGGVQYYLLASNV